MYYRLDADGKTPIPVKDAHDWWEQNLPDRIAGRNVADTFVVWGVEWCDNTAASAAIRLGTPYLHVSTVFLGVDQGIDEGKPPVLWETTILVRGLEVRVPTLGGHQGRWYPDDYRDQYSSHDDALAGHGRAVVLARQLIKTSRPSGSAVTWDDLHLDANGTLRFK